MSYNIFIDGGEGTTGLKIKERFVGRSDVTLLRLPEEKRKDISARKEMINQADYVFLCLPDGAAVEAVSLLENPNVTVIDASTAHRTKEDWAYGLPELSKEHFNRIATEKRIAVPGCYASGFLSLAYPLVAGEIMGKEHPVTCYGLSGYSGGGKNIIAQYEDDNKKQDLFAPRIYALGQTHKHQAEMQKIAGLEHKPLFNPIINNYYAGMLVSIPLVNRTLQKEKTAEEIHSYFQDYYKGQEMVRVMPFMGDRVLEDGFLAGNTLENKDYMEIFVFGHEEQTLVTARLDNLGKGASGAAVQCMNISMGIDPKTGLNV